MSSSILECDIATLDLTNPSLIIHRLKEICPTETQIEEYLKLLDKSMGSISGDFVLISTGTSVKFESIKSTIQFFKGVRKIEGKYAKKYRKAFIVGVSKRHKFLLPFYYIFVRPIAPRVYVETEEEAIDLASLEMGIPYY